MNDKERIRQLENQLKTLQEGYEYYRGEAESFWAGLRKRQELNLEIAQKVVMIDSKAIANIILNMYFGKMPGDSVGFCEIFGLKEKGSCKDGERCTDCIDNFLRQHYSEK